MQTTDHNHEINRRINSLTARLKMGLGSNINRALWANEIDSLRRQLR